jgi:hypothetical protein
VYRKFFTASTDRDLIKKQISFARESPFAKDFQSTASLASGERGIIYPGAENFHGSQYCLKTFSVLSE